jgi:hypothetical protein
MFLYPGDLGRTFTTEAVAPSPTLRLDDHQHPRFRRCPVAFAHRQVSRTRVRPVPFTGTAVETGYQPLLLAAEVVGLVTAVGRSSRTREKRA